ncbi:bifunctional nuclease family protein [Vulcanisaeta thermophila]|uniref:bifunctional nuclease family protein n=1 Tax=Vulcanisaeta thermophila TaxID=867917 RepID=UPI0008537BAF|nr:bifunctional nuclease domain-containing protein [Vulcanisaeta thermophila]
MVREEDSGNKGSKYLKADLLDVLEIPEEGVAVMLFTTEEWEDRVLPIRIDLSASFSIKKALGLISFQRPLTHDLLVDLLNRLDVVVEKVTIDAMIDGVYLATIFVKDQRTNETFQLDARPSDATAIAVRVGAPIYVADHLVAYTEPLDRYRELRARYGFSFEKGG